MRRLIFIAAILAPGQTAAHIEPVGTAAQFQGKTIVQAALSQPESTMTGMACVAPAEPARAGVAILACAGN